MRGARVTEHVHVGLFVLSMSAHALSLGLWRLLDTAKVLVPSCVELGSDSVTGNR